MLKIHFDLADQSSGKVDEMMEEKFSKIQVRNSFKSFAKDWIKQYEQKRNVFHFFIKIQRNFLSLIQYINDKR